ncbi:MAG: leucine-rich repeat domain-containing protein [Coleofasciculus sp. C1-SOL-03]|uniref:leucine-rich repeat domain-containing protein n=1 Tax=Coleofasciculus sp. C1-SOL-03 TaxID=3069522 RepID=UPI003300A085
MKWISVFALSLSIWGLGCGVAIAAEPSLGSSFKEWCLNRGSLSDETRKTVYILLEQAGTSNCEQADATLLSRTELQLWDNSITDISPLAGLSNLTELFLSSNSITDASPLAQLTNLRRLFLGDNPIAQPTCPVSPPSVCSFSPRCLLFSVEGSETYCIKFQDF